MDSRRLFQVLGFVSGFLLVDYGFDLISVGLPGAGTFMLQFLAANLLVSGSALIFGSVFVLLKPSVPTPPHTALGQRVLSRPGIGVELVMEEERPSENPGLVSIAVLAIVGLLLGAVIIAMLVIPDLQPKLVASLLTSTASTAR